MLDLAKVRLEQFAACLTQEFEIVFAGGALPAKLIEARHWGPDHSAGVRQPFTLTFRIDRRLKFPQGIYKMRHAALGEMEIFLVQVGGDENSSTLEAVFN